MVSVAEITSLSTLLRACSGMTLDEPTSELIVEVRTFVTRFMALRIREDDADALQIGLAAFQQLGKAKLAQKVSMEQANPTCQSGYRALQISASHCHRIMVAIKSAAVDPSRINVENVHQTNSEVGKFFEKEDAQNNDAWYKHISASYTSTLCSKISSVMSQHGLNFLKEDLELTRTSVDVLEPLKNGNSVRPDLHWSHEFDTGNTSSDAILAYCDTTVWSNARGPELVAALSIAKKADQRTSDE